MGLQGELHLTQCLTKECVQLTGSRGCAYALPGSRLQQRDERLPVDQLVAGPPVCVCVKYLVGVVSPASMGVLCAYLQGTPGLVSCDAVVENFNDTHD